MVLLDYLRQAGWFLLASTGVAALATVILPLIGYATFGDRPGPGWYGPPSALTWSGVVELAGYAVALPVFGALGVLFYFVVPFVAVRLLERTLAPQWLTRGVGGLLCAVLAWVVIAGAGWYIALGTVAGGAGVVGGLLYGLVKLPRPGLRSRSGSPAAVT